MYLILMYLSAIVLADLSVVYFGPASTILNAFLFIGLDLTSRDSLHERWRGKRLWLKMFLLIGAGSLLSFVINRAAGQIAVASMLAFLLSNVADAVTYDALGNRSKLVRVNGSNLVSAMVDSLVFPYVAFGGFIWWVTLGQFVAKVAGGFLWSLLLKREAK